MPITFACDCGKQLKVGDEFAGKRAKCPACAAVLAVPTDDSFPTAPPPLPLPATTEDDAYKLLDDGPPAPTARRTDRDVADDFGRPSASAPPSFRRRDPDAPPRAKYREVSDTEPDPQPRASGGGPHFPTVFGGLFSMALGGLFCWLRNGGVSIVGIVLLALGFFSVVKGLLGYQDD